MNAFSRWLKNTGRRLTAGLQRFMTGRYGTDKLNTLLLGMGLACCLVAMFVLNIWVRLMLTVLSYGFMFWAMFRFLSRNTYKRYQENRKYLLLVERIKDREHRYFTCARCKQTVRVPRKKGKIAITCPKCGEKFVKKT